MARKTNFRTYTISLSAGQEYPLNVGGDFFRVLENTNQFSVTFDESNRFTDQEAGMGAKFVDEYDRVVFLSATTQTIVVVLGYGTFEDSRASINATINTTIAPSDTLDNTTDITVSTSAVLLKAADANMKELLIHVPSDAANSIRVGNASVTSTSGLEVEPGMSLQLSIESAVYAIRDGSSDVVVSTLKLTRP
jgi:hypothetical protein